MHTYTWDADGNSVTLDGIGLTFDALDRMVEQNRSGAYTQIVYAPADGKLALMSGQTLQKAFVPLPGQATAVYTSSGLDHYRHADWLGSARLTSTPARAVGSTAAYAPFGETYAQSGIADLSFTGENQDTVSGDYDFLFREYSTQGRWPSPDPAGLGTANPMNPQSWNRYAYALNNPLGFVDPLGLYCKYYFGDYVVSIDSSPDMNIDVCINSGGVWIEPTETVTVSANGPDPVGTSDVPNPPLSLSITSGNTSWAWTFTKAFVKGWFTQGLSDQPGSCTAVFLNSVPNSAGGALRSAATNLQKYYPALASGAANVGPQAEEAIAAIGAMVAGGQLSPAVGAVATNIITGTAPLAAAAAPYVVRAGGYAVLTGFDALLLNGLVAEVKAIKNGQCKP